MSTPTPSLSTEEPLIRANRQRLRAWRGTAWIAGCFSLVLALGMFIGHINTRAEDPLKSPQLKTYKEQLRQNPTDEAAKQRIRDLDLRLRHTYFQQLSRMRSGVYLLLGGLGIFIMAVTRVEHYTRKLPMPTPGQVGPDPAQASRIARWSVATSGAGVALLLLLLGSQFKVAAPEAAPGAGKILGGSSSGETVVDAASPSEMRSNWPSFRGVDGGSVCLVSNLPPSWDTNGTGVAWKVPSPAPGFNSPIIWGDRVFFSGGDVKDLGVFCFNLKTGALAWRQSVTNVAGSPNPPPEIPESTGYACPTMATDGRRVYTMFANGDVAAFTLDGRPVWSKGFGALKNAYGFANSLATWQDRLIIQLDQGDSAENLSKLVALDGRTGRVLWQKPRAVGSSWASPIVIEAAGKPQIITLSVPWVIAYSPQDGSELWRVECLNGEVTPSPVFAGGLLFVASPSEKLLALRPDGAGDVTKTHVAWTTEENVPDVTSPTSDGQLLFTLTTPGMLTCFDAKDGKKLWEHDFEMECNSSPLLANNKVYLFSQKGRAVVVDAAREFKELFRTEMGDAFSATPAPAPDRLVVRGIRYIWGLGPGSGAAAPAK